MFRSGRPHAACPNAWAGGGSSRQRCLTWKARAVTPRKLQVKQGLMTGRQLGPGLMLRGMCGLEQNRGYEPLRCSSGAIAQLVARRLVKP